MDKTAKLATPKRPKRRPLNQTNFNLTDIRQKSRNRSAERRQRGKVQRFGRENRSNSKSLSTHPLRVVRRREGLASAS